MTGRVVRWTTAGESHGKALLAVVEGIPAGVDISVEKIKAALSERRSGIGRGERQKFEQDDIEIISGVIQGKTIASPISILIHNTEWSKWSEIMSAQKVEKISQEQPNVIKGEENDPLQRPRPGHADLEGILKYGFTSAREVLERSSARETAARVAAGSIAMQFLEQALNSDSSKKSQSSKTQDDDFRIDASVVQFGSIYRNNYPIGEQGDIEFENESQKFADEALKNHETIGGVVQVVVKNPPRSLGSYISADERLDSALAGAMMSIQAVKGVEIGDGFEIAGTKGSLAHDFIELEEFSQTISSRDSLPKTMPSESDHFVDDNNLRNCSTSFNGVQRTANQTSRRTNHAGGIEGGISNGEDLIIRIAVKPIPSVQGGLKTVNLSTGEDSLSHSQRSDISAVYPAQHVAKAMTALVLADFFVRRYGEVSLNSNHNSEKCSSTCSTTHPITSSDVI